MYMGLPNHNCLITLSRAAKIAITLLNYCCYFTLYAELETPACIYCFGCAISDLLTFSNSHILDTLVLENYNKICYYDDIFDQMSYLKSVPKS